jgi:hypothetical protein
MSITIKLNGRSYTVAATPSQDSRGNWICATYTIDSVTQNLPQDTTQAVHTWPSCAQAEQDVTIDATRVIASRQ